MTKKTCTVPGCDKPHRARGLCQNHYKQADYWSQIEVRRTPQGPTPKFSNIGLRITTEERNKIEVIARRRGKTISEFIRWLIATLPEPREPTP